MYLATKFFNNFIPGQEVPIEIVKMSWLESGLVTLVEKSEPANTNTEIENLDPEKPKRAKK